MGRGSVAGVERDGRDCGVESSRVNRALQLGSSGVGRAVSGIEWGEQGLYEWVGKGLPQDRVGGQGCGTGSSGVVRLVQRGRAGSRGCTAGMEGGAERGAEP